MEVIMRDISKSFSNNQVLDNVQLAIGDKEIHALVGENGAGKSTLMKILTGVYSKDSGEIIINDEKVDMNCIAKSEAMGIAIIHQELNVLPQMTIIENLFLGKELRKHFGLLDTKRMKKISYEILKTLGLEISPHTLMADLSVGQQQLCEIAKALLMEAKLIIMDEPTAALTEKETALLFNIILSLKHKGVSFIYISHRMEEIFYLCDKITILRDGKYINTLKISETNFNDIVERMVGYEIDERFPYEKIKKGRKALIVKNLTHPIHFKNINFELYEGEVLGFAGLMGSGRTELMHCLFGSDTHFSGDVYIYENKVNINNPKIAKDLGMGFITENRKTEGLILDASITDNSILCILEKIQKYFLINKNKMYKTVNFFANKLNLKAFNYDISVDNLSGGNQQKVVLAKWLATCPKILILDEPTRGVDVGAKKEIYKIINDLKKQGVAIIVVSSELPEVMGISDRIAVMREGNLVSILSRDEIDQASIMHYAMGGQ